MLIGYVNTMGRTCVERVSADLARVLIDKDVAWQAARETEGE
jgi:hypothetical protein